MKKTLQPPGLYGKMYVLGDFVSRRLPAPFIRTWDAWLQGALSASRGQLGPNWLDIYLTSPIWRFILSPGICGGNAWAGILMPSVDTVGRYFPLTLAVPIGERQALPETFRQAAGWYEGLERLALSALDDEVDVTSFDRKLQAHTFPLSLPENEERAPGANQVEREGKFAFQARLEKHGQMTDAFVHLGDCLLRRFLPCYSLWATPGSEDLKPALMVYEDLPPVEAYSDMLLAGQHQTDGTAGEPAASVALGVEDPLKPVEKPARLDGLEGMCFHWHSSARTTAGRLRQVNEDAFLERPENGLWAVADGMGGHSAGDVASHAVVDALSTLSGSGNLETLTAAASECLHKVNADLVKKAASFGPEKTIGTTVVVMLAAGERCATLWVGDSRLYLYRRGKLQQLTHDHTPEVELSCHEEPVAENFADKAPGNIVTRAIGGEPELLIDSITFEAKEGDVYLICSDGLIKEVTPNEIAAILGDGRDRESSQQLIDLALERGARDNVTVIVVQPGQVC